MNINKNGNILVVLSGGQDSVTCLGYALKYGKTVSAISFHYGQRHAIELQCARQLCEKYNVAQKVVALDFLPDLVTSALTGDGEVGQPHAHKPGLPSSFVPNRNALFLTIAHAHAQEIGATVILTGVCQTDYSGYPDCRDEFVRSLAATLNVGYQTNIQIATPLMFLTKGQTFSLAEDVGFLQEVLDMSHTCYNGDHETKHEWGYGCGTCPACQLRAKGWEEYKEIKAYKDKLIQPTTQK
jgi:7-cyano-7-deazaguanine synthase